MIEWDGFRYFLALHRKQTLKAAANELGVNQTTVGRRIEALESGLGTQLFEKRSNGYFLTLAGELVLPSIEETERSFLSMERGIVGREDKVEGVVRIAMPGALANHWFIPRLSDFMRRYPRIELEFLTGPDVVNLARREADLAIRLVKPSQLDLVARKIGVLKIGLYGHPSLWRKGRKPTRIEDLEKFPFIGLFTDATSEIESSLLEKLQPHLRYALRSAAWSSVYYAVQAGLGIGILPALIAEGEPELVQLDVIAPASATLWLVVHPDIVQSARVRAVIDYLSSSLKS